MVLSDLSIRRPVFITMIMLAFVVLGVFALRRLSIDEFPNVDLPVITVTTTWAGAGRINELNVSAERGAWAVPLPTHSSRWRKASALAQGTSLLVGLALLAQPDLVLRRGCGIGMGQVGAAHAVLGGLASDHGVNAGKVGAAGVCAALDNALGHARYNWVHGSLHRWVARPRAG